MTTRRPVIILTGVWLALTAAHVGLPPEWQDVQAVNLVIGAGVVAVVAVGVVLISRRQR